MQTFLPFSDFERCARVLDSKRLYKQCYDGLQLLTLCEELANGRQFPTLPRVHAMWAGHELLLWDYTAAMVKEWRLSTIGETETVFELHLRYSVYNHPQVPRTTPAWLSDERLFSNHRARLLFRGALDVVRERAKWVEWKTGRKIRGSHRNARHYSIADHATVTAQLNEYDAPQFANWYRQFNWQEEMTDDKYWPVIEDTSCQSQLKAQPSTRG